MSDEAAKTSKRRWRRKTVGAACATVLLVYALGIGPAWRLAWSNGNFHFLLTAYRPFIWASGVCRPFAYALQWYLRLWTS
jgi:hypothetical protein